MGIQARELLGAPFDTLNVISSGGSSPPLSCLNDGLQVSTGASLGRGAIAVVTGEATPEAVFVFRNQRLRLRLKPFWQNKIRNDIKRAVAEYGRNTPKYFAHVRRLSIQYWLDMDRNELFEEVWE